MRKHRLQEGCLTNTVLALFIAAPNLMLAGCGLVNGDEMKFPNFEIVAPMLISKVDVFPEENVCSIENESVIEALITRWSQDYSEGWKRSYVSLAPSYRITIGGTDILILKKGLAIVTQKRRGERVTYSRELPEEITVQIVRDACSAQ